MDSPAGRSRFSLVILCKVPAVYMRQPVSRLLPPPSSPSGAVRSFSPSVYLEKCFFKKKKQNKTVYLFTGGARSSPQRGRSLVATRRGATRSERGLLGTRRRLLTAGASLAAEHGLWGLWGSPPARDRPCIARRILNHWTTREAEHLVLLL